MAINNPKDWLRQLSVVLDKTKSKVGRAEASFDVASKEVMALLKTSITGKRSVFWVGNGGSASICAHLSQDMMNKLNIKSLYFGETSLLTCMANDFGYEQVYAKPLKQFVQKEDILIAISSSGNSDNILNCVKIAQDTGMKIITLSGMREDNKLWNSQSDVSFFLSSDLYGIVEVGHEALLHGMIETLWLQTALS
ncbi:MAG: SIS domain-containing protein [Pseudomonadota bacterium]